MARPVYQHELADPDFCWLVTTFQENHSEYVAIEMSGMPVVFFKMTPDEYHRSMLPSDPLTSPPAVRDTEES